METPTIEVSQIAICIAGEGLALLNPAMVVAAEAALACGLAAAAFGAL